MVSSRETYQGKVAVVVSGQSPLSVPTVSLCTVVATYGMFVLWDLIDDVYRLPGCPSPAAGACTDPCVAVASAASLSRERCY